MTEMYKHASLVVPVSVPPSLPRQVSMEASSAWHTSALTASAIESVLLPARLRDHSNRDTLGNMSDLLNTRGKQNVAGLHMSVSSTRGENDTDVRQAATPNGVAESSEGVRLGLDLSPSDCLEHGHGQQQGPHRPRIFSQLLVQRGGDGHEKDALDAEGAAARNRRRSPQETFLRR